MKRSLQCLILFFILAPLSSNAVTHVRWSIKTSVISGQTPRSVSIDDILNLANPPGVTSNDARYDATRIPPFDNPLHLKEGDLIKVIGWIRLVAQADDNDYHIQITSTKDILSNCLIVEIPSPTETIADPSLGSQFEKLRKWISDTFFGGHQPNDKLLTDPVQIDVVGQLFFDDFHVADNNRGRGGMKSLTVWELHPVIDIGLAGSIVIPVEDHGTVDTGVVPRPPENPIRPGVITMPDTTPLTLLIFIVLGAILGMVGQVARVLVGIKKDKDAATVAGKPFVFDSQQMFFSLMIALIIGGIAGVIIGVNSVNNTNSIDKTTVLLMIAGGYAGTDLIEGLIIH